MVKLLVIGGLFVLAGLCEIGGGYLVWGWLRQDGPFAWALIGAVILALYGVVAALQPIEAFGCVYAAYGGVFIALTLLWGSSGGGMASRQIRHSGSRDRHPRCHRHGRASPRLASKGGS